jgi:diacylglycerol kinase family enzyme
VSGYFKSDRKHPRMTVELPGRDPIEGTYLAFVSNVDPWTYFGKRPVRTNPDTSPWGGLGVFTLTKMGVPTALRVSAEILRTNAAAKSSKSIIRAQDVDWVNVRCKEPVDLQVDGDYLGTRSEVEFVSVPNALRLVL